MSSFALHLFRSWTCSLLGIVLAACGICSAGLHPPVDIVFVLNVNRSMADPNRFVGAGAHLATLQFTEMDRAAVLTVASGIKWRSGLTGDRMVMERALQEALRAIAERQDRLRIYDAIWIAVNSMVATEGRRRCVILISNDADRGSSHSSDEVVRELRAKNVSLNALLIRGPHVDPSQVRNGMRGIPYPDVQAAARELRAITEDTGGSVSIVDMNGYVLLEGVEMCRNQE